MMAYSVRTEIE